MSTPIVDCHTHTRFSDGEPTFEENVRAAAAAGCRVLASTDHLTLPASMDPELECQVPEAELAAHRRAFEAARQLATEIAPELELVYGFECDWSEGCEPLVERWSADTWCRACESPLNFQSMAHPDLAMRFAREGFAPTLDLRPLWDQMAACAHDTGRHIEVSTAGLRKSVGDYYPTRGLLERFAHAGVPITVGSDAHRACDVCWGILEAYRFAWECGYRSFDAPRADGPWQTFEL